MSYIGRKLRIRRMLFKGVDAGLIIPIDHGLTMGPIKGISSINEISKWITNESISAIISHKGTLELLTSNNMLHSNTGAIVHLNGMSNLSNDPDTKQMVTDVESAVRLGADAVSIQVNFLNTNFNHNLDTIGRVVDEAHKYGLPVLTMLYDKVKVVDQKEKVERMQKLTCSAVELGVDALKISFPDNLSQIEDSISHLRGSIKIFFAGGDMLDENQLISMTATAMRSGITGLCAGRNVFQNPDPVAIINRLGEVIKCKGYGGGSGPIYKYERDAAAITSEIEPLFDT